MINLHLVRTVKTGNGLSINIPKEIRDVLQIERGDHLVMAVYEMGTIVMRKPTQTELLQIKPRNIAYGKSHNEGTNCADTNV